MLFVSEGILVLFILFLKYAYFGKIKILFKEKRYTYMYIKRKCHQYRIRKNSD